MEENSKILHSVWDKSPERITSKKTEHKISDYNRLITSLFCPGPHYYYIVDFYDRQIKEMSKSIKTVLGLDHQTIILTVDDNYGFVRSLNIHTNIHHLTTENNKKIHLIGISDETDIIELEVNDQKAKIKSAPLFSKRETEIINLITLGFTNDEIAERLFISTHTVKNHRKNILKKAEAKNSVELIKKCMNSGLL